MCRRKVGLRNTKSQRGRTFLLRYCSVKSASYMEGREINQKVRNHKPAKA